MKMPVVKPTSPPVKRTKTDAQKKRRRKRIMLLLIPSAIILILIILIFKSCGNNTPEPTKDTDNPESGKIPDNVQNGDESDGDMTIYIPVNRDSGGIGDEEFTKAELTAVQLVLTQDMGNEYIDKFLFLCDFTTFGLKSYGMLTEGRGIDRVISGISGSFFVSDGSAGLVYLPGSDEIMTAADAAKKLSPEYMLISVGYDDINGSPKPDRALFKASYTELIKSIAEASPDTKIVCMSILPGMKEDGGVPISEVEKYNRLINEAAADAGAYYFNIAAAFSGSNGYMRPDCGASDSRLCTIGYKRLTELLRTYKIPEPKPAD